jgi:acyl dehydratase
MRAAQSAGSAGLVAASEGSLVVSVSVVTLSSVRPVHLGGILRVSVGLLRSRRGGVRCRVGWLMPVCLSGLQTSLDAVR